MGAKIFVQPSFASAAFPFWQRCIFPRAKWPQQQQQRDVLLLLTAGWEVTKKTRRKSKNQHGLCPLLSIPLWVKVSRRRKDTANKVVPFRIAAKNH